MHAIERRPNYFRFQASRFKPRRSWWTPTNFHPLRPLFVVQSARSQSFERNRRGWTRAPPNYSHEPRKNRIGVGGRTSTATDKRSILSAGSRKRNPPKSQPFPPKVRETSSLSSSPPSDYPFSIRFERFSILFLRSSTFPFVRTNQNRGERRWKMTMMMMMSIFPFFFRGKLKRIFVIRFVCLRNEECFENKWMECCF